MPKYDFQSPRLYVSGALKAGAELALEKPQAHYLRHVLRHVLLLRPLHHPWLLREDGGWERRFGLARVG